METDSGQRAMMRRREGARGRRERRLRAEARIRLQLCRDAVRIASHRGGEGWQSKTSVGVQTAREEESDEENYAKGQMTPLPAGTQHFMLDGARRPPARQDRYPVRTTGAGSAAHRGTDRRRSPSGASSRRSCAADGGTAGGRPPFLRYAVSCFRAGYRSAEDLA